MSDVIEHGYPRAGGLRGEEMRTPDDGKSPTAQETRAPLTARKLLQAKRHDVEMNLRGVLRGFGLKVGPTTPKSFEARVRELVEGHPTLETVAEGLLAARAPSCCGGSRTWGSGSSPSAGASTPSRRPHAPTTSPVRACSTFTK